MSKVLPAVSRLPWYRQAPKVVAAAASTGAACVSVFTFLYSFGVVGESETRNAVGSLGVAWIGLQPAADTATAIGDTLHLAATITDDNGAVIVKARPVWTSDHPEVASIGPGGTVIAKRPGTTTVTVALGSVVARSRIVVQQQVASIEVADRTAGGAVVVPEGDRHVLTARARDARGHAIDRMPVSWSVEDSTVLALDSTGHGVGGLPGRTRATASIGSLRAHVAVHVVAAPGRVELVAGDSQHVEAGAALPQAVAVRVTSRRGIPIGGVPVRFRALDGGGAPDPASAMTDAEGRARTSWRLGTLPGRQSLLVTADGVDSALHVAAEADAVPANTRIAAVTQDARGAAGAPLAEPVSVQLTDTTGRLLRDVPVRWLALDGSVEALSVRTDSLGTARARWTLGREAGRQRLQAQVGTTRGPLALAPATITATALAGAPAKLVLASGDAQRGTAGGALRKPIVLRVQDAVGNGVSGVAVLLKVSAGSADSLVLTDSLGAATVAWTLGQAAGGQSLRASVPETGLRIEATATARPAAPANLVLEEVKDRRSAKGRQLVATVTDVYGNAVPDASVRLATTAGSVAPARAVTDAKGRVVVKWTLAGTAARKVTARVTDTDVQAAFAEEASPVRQAGTTRKPAATKPTRP